MLMPSWLSQDYSTVRIRDEIMLPTKEVCLAFLLLSIQLLFWGTWWHFVIVLKKYLKYSSINLYMCVCVYIHIFLNSLSNFKLCYRNAHAERSISRRAEAEPWWQQGLEMTHLQNVTRRLGSVLLACIMHTELVPRWRFVTSEHMSQDTLSC